MGIARLIKNGWIGVSGVARRFFTLDVTLYELELGSTITYNSKNYTVIAKDYGVSGDVILWDVSASKTSSFSLGTSTSPFGTSNTNKLTIYYNTDDGDGNAQDSMSYYGWMLPKKTIGASTTYGSPAMSYFSSNTQRVRSTAYHLPDVSYKDEDSSYYWYVNTSGTVTRANSRGTRDTYWAYSVKGTLLVKQNSAGNWELQI